MRRRYLVKGNEGIVLLTAVLFSVVVLLLVAGFTQLLTGVVRNIGGVRRYTTALEAAKSAVVQFRGVLMGEDIGSWNGSIHKCKLLCETTEWKSDSGCCGSLCSSVDCTGAWSSPREDAKSDYDWSNDYGDYKVYIKVLGHYVGLDSVNATLEGGTYPEAHVYVVEIASLSNKESLKEVAHLRVVYTLLRRD